MLLFRQFVNDDLGLRLLSDRRSGGGRRGRRRPAASDRACRLRPRARPASASSACSRRTPTPTTSPGHGRFALEHGLPVAIHPLAEPAFAFEALAGRAGRSTSARCGSTVLHTPGHRPEHCAFLVDDEVVLTGDSLFVGDAARPDLAVDAREGAEDLFRSLQRLTALPDSVQVLPGHVAGSLCGGNMSSERSSTIGQERVEQQRRSSSTTCRSSCSSRRRSRRRARRRPSASSP